MQISKRLQKGVSYYLIILDLWVRFHALERGHKLQFLDTGAVYSGRDKEGGGGRWLW